MADRERVIEGLMCCQYSSKSHCDGCAYCYEGLCETNDCTADLASDALTLLKKPEAIKPKTIPEELKLKMWNALYAKEDKFEKKYIGTKEQNSWFLIYCPWLQEGFNLAIKAIADWEGE